MYHHMAMEPYWTWLLPVLFASIIFPILLWRRRWLCVSIACGLSCALLGLFWYLDWTSFHMCGILWTDSTPKAHTVTDLGLWSQRGALKIENIVSQEKDPEPRKAKFRPKMAPREFEWRHSPVAGSGFPAYPEIPFGYGRLGTDVNTFADFHRGGLAVVYWKRDTREWLDIRRGVVIPFWMLMSLFAFIGFLAWRLDKRARIKYLVRQGHCPCGYDLRGHREALASGPAVGNNCPECGRAIAPAKIAAKPSPPAT